MNCLVVIVGILLGQEVILAKPLSNSCGATEVEFRSKKSTVRSIAITFEAFAEGGLRVTVLNAAGLSHLSFKAKINLPLGTKRNGHLVRDIEDLMENEFVIDFPDRLLVGDAINYWILIRYNGLSLNSKSLSYVVCDLTPGPIDISTRQGIPITASIRPTTPLYFSPTTPRRKPQGTPDCTCNKDTLTDMWEKMNTTANKVLILEQTISPLKDKIKSLTETIDELIDIENVGTSLLLTGNLPAETNAVEDVRHLLIEKLNLRDLSSSIIQAQYECGKIAFEVTSPVDKLRILKRSRDILSKLAYRIEDPKRRETTEAEGTCNDSIQIDPRFYVDDDDPNAYSSPKVPPTHPLNVKSAIKIQRGDAA